MDDLAHGFDDGVAESEAEAESLAQDEWVGALDFQAEFAQIERHTQSFESMGRAGGKGCMDDEIAGFYPGGHTSVLWEFPFHVQLIVQLGWSLDTGCKSGGGMGGTVRRLC